MCNGERALSLKNTLFVPELRLNRMSFGKMADSGNSVLFRKYDALIMNKTASIRFTAHRENGLYHVNEIKLNCYVDADRAGDKRNRKLISEIVFKIGKSTINWISKKQSIVAMLSN